MARSPQSFFTNLEYIMANQIETNLFEEELTDADLMAVVGGNVSSTLEGVTAGVG